MSKVDELIARSKALRERGKVNTSFGQKERVQEIIDESVQLPWKGFHLWVLAPEDFEWGSVIINWYLPEHPNGFGSMIVSPTREDIIHGHGPEERCFARHQCHVLGWRPTGNEPKSFLERWKKFGYD